MTKRVKVARFVMFAILLCVVAELAQSCNSARRCGCGVDLNTVYKPRKRNYR